MNAKVIKLEHVNKRYDDGFQALKDINLEFRQGNLNVLIGPSGCGKTTTMKLINRLIQPSSGTITIGGKNIAEIDPVTLRRSIGYVIQNIGLFPHMTIAANVAVVPKLLKWDSKRTEKRIDELLELVGLDPDTYRSRYPSELSGGQQQRIGVIRALAGEPDIILMDEPFSALDPISREQLQDELVRLQQELKKTIIFVTHDMDEAIPADRRTNKCLAGPPRRSQGRQTREKSSGAPARPPTHPDTDSSEIQCIRSYRITPLPPDILQPNG